MQVCKLYFKKKCNKGGRCSDRPPQACFTWQRDKSCNFCGICKYTHSLVVSAGGGGPAIPHSIAAHRCMRRAEASRTIPRKELAQCALDCGFVCDSKRKVAFNDEILIIFLKVETGTRQYVDGERRRPLPKPKDWLIMGRARVTIDVRVSLRAIRLGHELSADIIRNPENSTLLVDQSATHASTTTCGRSSSPRSRRWAVDSVSCVDITQNPPSPTTSRIISRIWTPGSATTQQTKRCSRRSASNYRCDHRCRRAPSS